MQADFSVELGADDPELEYPWASPDGGLRHYDLKRQPDLLLYVEEARRERPLGEFLAAINARGSCLESVKCDAWFSRELDEEEAIYGAAAKFGSYVDLIFAEEEPRVSLLRHQDFALRLAKLLKRAPEIPAAAEFVIRRCWYRDDPAPGEQEGYGVTFYCFGYGDNEAEARQRWTIALKLVENAILQLSAQLRAEWTAPDGTQPAAG